MDPVTRLDNSTLGIVRQAFPEAVQDPQFPVVLDYLRETLCRVHTPTADDTASSVFAAACYAVGYDSKVPLEIQRHKLEELYGIVESKWEQDSADHRNEDSGLEALIRNIVGDVSHQGIYHYNYSKLFKGSQARVKKLQESSSEASLDKGSSKAGSPNRETHEAGDQGSSSTDHLDVRNDTQSTDGLGVNALDIAQGTQTNSTQSSRQDQSGSSCDATTIPLPMRGKAVSMASQSGQVISNRPVTPPASNDRCSSSPSHIHSVHSTPREISRSAGLEVRSILPNVHAFLLEGSGRSTV